MLDAGESIAYKLSLIHSAGTTARNMSFWVWYLLDIVGRFAKPGEHVLSPIIHIDWVFHKTTTQPTNRQFIDMLLVIKDCTIPQALHLASMNLLQWQWLPRLALGWSIFLTEAESACYGWLPSHCQINNNEGTIQQLPVNASGASWFYDSKGFASYLFHMLLYALALIVSIGVMVVLVKSVFFYSRLYTVTRSATILNVSFYFSHKVFHIAQLYSNGKKSNRYNKMIFFKASLISSGKNFDFL